MYREAFVRELAVAKVKENDRNYFPRWFARYARLQDCSTVDVPISVERVIAFCRVLLTSKTPAWQRLQLLEPSNATAIWSKRLLSRTFRRSGKN